MNSFHLIMEGAYSCFVVNFLNLPPYFQAFFQNTLELVGNMPVLLMI